MTDVPPDLWWSETESPKAWMSVRDADLYEALLHRLAVRRKGQPLRVLEWGAGRSTTWYTNFLSRLGAPFQWVAIEHDGHFVGEQIRPRFAARPDAQVIVEAQTTTAEIVDAIATKAVVVVAFDHGSLRPDLPGHELDRRADLSDYVGLPQRLGLTWDLVAVDGRHRRRCLLAAANVVASDGYVVLHDAWRHHYQCAWTAWRSGRRFGDEWWIGSQRPTDFVDVLPWHALERHATVP